MKQLKYVNTQGQVIDFRQFNTQVYHAGFHAYTWTYEGTEQRFGSTIDRFGKSVLEYEMTVAVRGADKEDSLNEITEITEYDIVNNKQGRLWWGDYYGLQHHFRNNGTVGSIFRSRKDTRYIGTVSVLDKRDDTPILPGRKRRG